MRRRDFGWGVLAALSLGAARKVGASSRRPDAVISKRIARETIEAATRELSQATGVQVDEGEVSGARLSGLHSKSVLGRIGLKNGDVMVSVNGRPTPAKEATEVLRQGFRRDRMLSLVFYRGDSRVLLRIEVAKN